MKNSVICNLGFPRKLLFGTGSIRELNTLIDDPQKALLLTDRVLAENGTIDRLLQNDVTRLSNIDIRSDIPIEPSATQVQQLISETKGKAYSTIIAIGGGSILDTAKLIASLMDQPFTVQDLLDDTSLLKSRKKGLILIPTTAGTGSEATPNSIVLDERTSVKVGIVNFHFIPDTVILDPNLTITLPPALTASTGMDALAHALECYASNKANPISDTFAMKAAVMIFRNLQKAYDNPDDLEARGQMLLAACFAGVAITASGTTAVHALSYPLGGRYRIPHGVSNAILLPAVMRFNADCIGDRLADVAQACPDVFPEPTADSVIQKLYELKESLRLPASFSDFGVTAAEIESLTEQALTVKRLLNNNMKTLNAEDVRSIYKEVIR